MDLSGWEYSLLLYYLVANTILLFTDSKNYKIKLNILV